MIPTILIDQSDLLNPKLPGLNSSKISAARRRLWPLVAKNDEALRLYWKVDFDSYEITLSLTSRVKPIEHCNWKRITKYFIFN